MFKHNQYTRPLPDSAKVKIKMADVDAALSNRHNGLVQLSRALGNKMVASKTPNKLSHNDEVSKECKDRTKDLVLCFLRDDPPLPVKRSPAGLGGDVDLKFKITRQLGASRHQKLEEPRKAKDSPSQAQQTVNVITRILQCCRRKIANHKTWFQEQVCLQLLILTSSLIFDILYLYIRPRA
jgi:hypothetical protein